MFIYCTQYLVGAPFALITASIWRSMEVISLWHCWGGMEAQVSLTVAFSSSAFFGLLFLIFLLTISHRFSMGFRSGEIAGQSSTPTPWSFNQLLVLLAMWAGAKSCWKMKSASLKCWSSEESMKCSKMYCKMGAVTLVFQKHNGPTPADDIAPQIITDCGNLTLDFKQLGLWASPPFLQTLGPWLPKKKKKLALIWKEDFGPLGNSPVLLLLSPGKTPLTATVAKFLDMSVCGGSWCLAPSLSPFLVKFTQNFELILLDNPHKAAVLSVGCASFSSTLFPSTQLSVNMLGYSTLWTASFFCNGCLWLTLLVKGVNDCLLDNCQISSLPHDCVA